MPIDQPTDFSSLIALTGLKSEEIASFLGVTPRNLKRWENGEVQPKKAYVSQMQALAKRISHNAAYRRKNPASFRFIDLFAGIGGIRIPFQDIGGECVFTSEWDKFAKQTYAINFGEYPEGDITTISSKDIPEHDVLLAGFPCQAFSQAGLKQGFMDTRGTMFFEIQRILGHHRPKAFLLENVKQLRGHDKGRTLKTIIDILEGNNNQTIPDNVPMSMEARKNLKNKLNYHVEFRVLRAADFGVPQNRERVYIVGFNRDYFPKETDFSALFKWPKPSGIKTKLGKILFSNKKVEEKYTISDKLWAGHQRRLKEHKKKGNGFGYSLFNREALYANTLSARYYKDGSEILIDQSELGKNPRKLTPRECARLQGFEDDFKIEVSDVQAYKQFGNSVAVPVVHAVAESMKEVLEYSDKASKAA